MVRGHATTHAEQSPSGISRTDELKSWARNRQSLPVEVLARFSEETVQSSDVSLKCSGYTLAPPLFNRSGGLVPPESEQMQRPQDPYVLVCQHLFRGSMRAAVPAGVHIPQRSAAVRTGASQSLTMSSSSRETVMEQPAISSDVT